MPVMGLDRSFVTLVTISQAAFQRCRSLVVENCRESEGVSFCWARAAFALLPT
jgi:hypothetical protein